MPVFEKDKPALKEVITNLNSNPFVTPQQMKQILKEEYNYDYDPDTYNPDDLGER